MTSPTGRREGHSVRFEYLPSWQPDEAQRCAVEIDLAVVDPNEMLLERDGGFWDPPPDSATAIREFERLRGDGARFIALASNAFWWLDHYGEFSRHLSEHYRRVISSERQVVFELRR